MVYVYTARMQDQNLTYAFSLLFFAGTNREAIRRVAEEIIDVLGKVSTPAEWGLLFRGHLEEAAGEGKADLVDKLAEAGALFGTAFTKASSVQRWDTLRVLLRQLRARESPSVCFDVTADDGTNNLIEVVSPLVLKGVLTKPLEHAAERGVTDVVEDLLSAGSGVQPRLALHEAVMFGHMHATSLIARDNGGGSALHTYNNLGRSPLHIAAELGLSNIASMLLAKGSDVNAKRSEDDCTPLYLAIVHKCLRTMDVLLGAGANPNITSGMQNQTVVHAAVQHGYEGLPILKKFVEHGGIVDAQDSNNLHCTALCDAGPCGRHTGHCFGRWRGQRDQELSLIHI